MKENERLRLKLAKAEEEIVKLFDKIDDLECELALLKKILNQTIDYNVTDLDANKHGSYLITRTPDGDETREMC